MSFCVIPVLKLQLDQIAAAVSDMPLIKSFLRKGIRFHDIHDRAPMDHQCCLGNAFISTGFEHFIKTFQIPVRAFFLTLASRKRKGSVAVDPFLIVRIV